MLQLPPLTLARQWQARWPGWSWPLYSSARVPMWRGATVTCPYVTINFAGSIGPASGSASPPFTTFSSPGLMGRQRRSGFSVRSRARCLRRSWKRWSYHPRLCVHLGEPKVADAVIKACNSYIYSLPLGEPISWSSWSLTSLRESCGNSKVRCNDATRASLFWNILRTK